MTSALDRALVEEAARKSALVWVRGPADAPARALWHVWHDGAVWIVGGPDEQPLDGLGLAAGARATVTCRSKDKGGRLVVWPAEVTEPEPGGDAWSAAVAELAGKRLNGRDSADATAARWRTSCRVLRLAPAGAPEQRPGAMPDGPQAAPPRPSPALTRTPVPSGLPVRRRRRR
ncbi:hypothetical protein [Streptomyces sp. RFCAC02]|uniref:hypothetical protein n=1 Tax=Streptomyces sp. RFCAC02 TaxID=2499143 RepID=UPI0010223ECC|nr:hypothetical protein [Streptomyces sp. RFCAC02]